MFRQAFTLLLCKCGIYELYKIFQTNLVQISSTTIRCKRNEIHNIYTNIVSMYVVFWIMASNDEFTVTIRLNVTVNIYL